MRKQSDIDDEFGKGVRQRRVTIVFATLAVLLVVLATLNLCVGSMNVPMGDLLAIITGQDTSSTNYQVIWSIRLPRLIAAALLGGALALAGFLLQTFFNNPIAGPFILGISSGAKLVVAVMMILVVGGAGVMTSGMLIVSAFVGSLIAMVFVLLVSRRINSMSMLIVAGVMIGYICSAATDFLITFASDANIVNLKNWSLGSFSGINWNDIGIMTVVVLASSLAVFFLSKPISAFQLGEQYARSMGVNIRVFKVALILLSSLLAATVTAFAGPISFVGIAVPHIVKRMLGTSKPIVVIPGAFFGGAIFCLFCDLIARSVFAPTEVSISAVTAMFGAPVVIS
ncbi:MAG TPA: iron ABC transporter permease, partial [Eggerthellaceae bacterium]|nr:iron ABC transporter permease [Eggerthellaceae bacterium]